MTMVPLVVQHSRVRVGDEWILLLSRSPFAHLVLAYVQEFTLAMGGWALLDEAHHLWFLRDLAAVGHA